MFLKVLTWKQFSPFSKRILSGCYSLWKILILEAAHRKQMFNTLLGCIFLFGWQKTSTNKNQYISLRKKIFYDQFKISQIENRPCSSWALSYLGAVGTGPELPGCCRGTECHKGLWRRQGAAHTGYSVTRGLDLTSLWGLSSAGFCDLSRDLTLSFGWDAKHGLYGAGVPAWGSCCSVCASVCAAETSFLACLGGERRKAVLSPDVQLLPLAAVWRRWGRGWGWQRCPHSQRQMACSLQWDKPGFVKENGREQLPGRRSHHLGPQGNGPGMQLWKQDAAKAGSLVPRDLWLVPLWMTPGGRTLDPICNPMKWKYCAHLKTWGGCSPSRNSRASNLSFPATPGEDNSSLLCGAEAVQTISLTSSCVREADNVSMPMPCGEVDYVSTPRSRSAAPDLSKKLLLCAGTEDRGKSHTSRYIQEVEDVSTSMTFEEAEAHV